MIFLLYLNKENKIQKKEKKKKRENKLSLLFVTLTSYIFLYKSSTQLSF